MAESSSAADAAVVPSTTDANPDDPTAADGATAGEGDPDAAANAEGEAAPEAKADDTPPEKPIHPTFQTESLLALARSIGADGMKFAMCLDIPTTTIIRIKVKGKENGWDDDVIMHNTLIYWRLMKDSVKDKDKASDMFRALEHMGRTDIASVVAERFAQNSELTQDGLPAPVVPAYAAEHDAAAAGGDSAVPLAPGTPAVGSNAAVVPVPAVASATGNR